MNEKIISIEQAIEMRNEYHTHVKTSIENARGNGYQATDFAWIDLKTLKDYVALLEEINKSNSETISGVRIYFSAYPDASTFACDRTASVDLPARETLFIAPTVKVASSSLSSNYENLEHLPFCINPTDSNEPYKGDFVIINDLLCSNDNNSGSVARGSDYENMTSLIMNRATITPPPY
ncbi:hypothetical protein [Flavobacterium sp.]|uniref:hypothetical protein n=1 Tax=Flavobacterium sp. TaxID=239 RepID=UPI002B4B7A90|nr:hypothetical protein [Flavobacterium sp.]HLP63012.1 hypothetical protein [Flavobacterium sp.]